MLVVVVLFSLCGLLIALLLLAVGGHAFGEMRPGAKLAVQGA